MKIWIEVENTGGTPTPFILATHGRDGVSGLMVSYTPAVQVAQYLRAADQEPFDRGNLATTIQFTVTRTFGKIQECEAHLLTRGLVRPHKGTAWFELYEGGIKLRLVNALVTSIRSAEPPAGKTVRIAYEITGGRMAYGSSTSTLNSPAFLIP